MKRFLSFIFNIKTIKYTLGSLLAALCAVIIYVQYYGSRLNYSVTASVPKAPAAIILGAGLKGKEPSVYLKDRLDKGIDVYKEGKASVLLISGDNGDDRHDEVSAMQKYLIRHGIPESKILSDRAGFNTYGSMHRAKNIFNISEVIVVTQSYHLPRSVFTCRKVGMKCYGLSADKSSYAKIKRNTLREYPAMLKAFIDTSLKRSPKEFKTKS
ncbi:protein SanA [Parelusimicrobium proximum]|uniref:SanA/YdcF family protein n=1 Tax=Parelusimicrobium proximum TaxID=3228953 RepID=UPI003D16E88B